MSSKRRLPVPRIAIAACSLLTLSALAFATSARAGFNAGGTLIVHAQPGIQYSSDHGSYCGDLALAGCDEAITAVSGSDLVVFHAIAAFAPRVLDITPRLKAVTFGVEYSIGIDIIDHGGCGDFQLNTSGWPQSGSGTAISFDQVQTAYLTPLCWFAAYNADAPSPRLFALTPHPTQGGYFADDELPAQLDLIAGYGALGFDQPGDLPCPLAGGGYGACCFPDSHCEERVPADCTTAGGEFLGAGTACAPGGCNGVTAGACCYSNGECAVTSEGMCEAAGGSFQGAGSACAPGLCSPVPSEPISWGAVKARYR